MKIPTAELTELIGTLLARGVDADAIPAMVGRFIDDLVDYRDLVRGPVGELLEAADGPIVVAATKMILVVTNKKKLAARFAVGAAGE